MDKQHFKGASQQARGAMKSFAGRLTGNHSLRVEGQAEKIIGRLRRSLGTLKDRLKRH